jgi:hypothetical protein
MPYLKGQSRLLAMYLRCIGSIGWIRDLGDEHASKDDCIRITSVSWDNIAPNWIGRWRITGSKTGSGYGEAIIKTALGLYNDTQDMEFLHTYALLPQSTYPIAISAEKPSFTSVEIFTALYQSEDLVR